MSVLAAVRAPAAPRKLRKACSLPACPQLPGQCMHCACDGRCGGHAPGRCGARREGNGRGCKRAGCPRDDRCVHSNRATCCHCRNLVSTNGRAARIPAAAASASPLAVAVAGAGAGHAAARKRPHSGSPARFPSPAAAAFARSPKRPRADLSPLLAGPIPIPIPSPIPSPSLPLPDPSASPRAADPPAATSPPAADRALSECAQWRARRAACNLVVLVDGAQFNVHKHPVLLESALLRRRARPQAAAGRAVPVLDLPAFPGGARAFEALCVFAYSGDLPLARRAPLAAAVALARAAALLDMRSGPELQRRLLPALAAAAASAPLDELVAAASALDAVPAGACAALAAACADAAAARVADGPGPDGSGLDGPSAHGPSAHGPSADGLAALLRLPPARFLDAAQRLARGAGVLDALCLQAQLAQLQREAAVAGGARPADEVAAECLQLLRPAGGLAAGGAADADADADGDRALWQMMLEDADADAAADGALSGELSWLGLEPSATLAAGFIV